MPLTGFALEVHDKADIVKVTSAFLKVIPKGNRFTAICPFHADTNPSLSINPEKNIFKCFVCGAGGDSINFVRRYTGVSFREAVERVAQIMGIPIPTSFGKQTAAAPKVTGAQMALDDLQKFYRMMLVSPQGQRALDYLHNRGMDDATIEKFGIGYAPADGTMAIRSLRDKMGRSVEDLEEAGILSKGSAQLRDRYTERIMFPIRDAFGHTVGFSGRKYLPDDPSDSKYINSPETSLFIKSKLLYNLDNAWEPARKAGYIYVLEGFMDAIAVTRAGIPAAVALMGTALTKEHIGLLQRLHVQVRLCLDSDAAGQLAERNNAPLLSQAGVPYRVVKPFTQGKDADEVLHNAGPEALVAALNNLLDALTFRLQTLEPTSPDYLRSVDRIIAESGAEISALSPSEKELLIQNLVSSTNLNEDYWRSVLTRSPAPAPQLATPSVPQQEGPTIGEATNLVGTDRKVAKLVREARFKLPSACVEDIVYLKERRLGCDRVARLASCGWVEDREVVVIISKTGCGKSFISQALGHAACRRLFTVRYARLADIMDDLNRCRAAGDGSYYERMDAYKRVQLLIVDDFLTTPIATQGAIDLFEIMEAREGRAATLIASQLEPNEWYLRIEGELMADSILNRVATGARYIDLDGPNMREYFAKKRDS